jgi:2-hydroxyglutarate dehydrogenase
LVERHKHPGQETSSRNSEVIHAGLHYPPNSLKTNLCLRGRELLYSYCEEFGVPYSQTGKLVVGHKSSKEYLEGIVDHLQALNDTKGNLGALISGQRKPPPVRVITGDEARELEPDLGLVVGWTLDSSRTGIVSTHDLMATLERQTLDSESAEIVYDTKVVGLRPITAKGIEGWVVETETEGQVDSLLAKHVINASGLNGPATLNTLLKGGYLETSDARRGIGCWYSKGNYASYSKSKGGVSSIKRLIYPLPDMGSSKDGHGHQGLGTHLTVSLDGNFRFGPDTDWLFPPDPSERESDWWLKNLVALAPSPATLNQTREDERLKAMHESVTSFLPGLALDGLSPDYAGIRPKLTGPGGSFKDFGVLYHQARDLHRQSVWQEAFDWRNTDQSHEEIFVGDTNKAGAASMITLCGIESPGLTSSLAIAEMVGELVARRGWGDRGRLKNNLLPKGAQNEEAGGLDSWA